MKIVKVQAVEELLAIDGAVKKVEIEAVTVLRYIHHNKNMRNQRININELRNVYAKSINKSYSHRRYQDNIVFSSNDVKKVCCIRV